MALICEYLVRQGHDVTLLAAAGSTISGRVVKYRWAGERPRLVRALVKLEAWAKCMVLATCADVVLACVRSDYLKPILKMGTPLVYVFHNPIRQFEVDYLVAHARGGLHLVSVSNAQRAGLSEIADWTTIYNATELLDERHALKRTGTEGVCIAHKQYVVYLGLISYDKGIDLAISAAREAGIYLIIAGKVPEGREHQQFFDEHVAPALAQGLAEYIGEVNNAAKVTLLGGAMALLVPSRIYESFGIVIAEALACGTPVVGSGEGGIAEAVRAGKTGFIARSVADIVDALSRIETISRDYCLAEARRRFHPDIMGRAYEDVLKKAIDKTRR